MSFSAGVQWWEHWQLRLLVLASLFFQYFLFAAAIVRKRRIPHWFRALIWLSYLAGDVVAIYALATLLSRHKEEELATHPKSAHLDTLWAPILLLHLGGQDGITAYSIEDNENWRRHLLVAVSQITVAIYVFRKSWWSDDKKLLRAAILLFIPGIYKCLEKPWALKNATVASIMNSSDPRMQQSLEYDAEIQKGVDSLEKYVDSAAKKTVDSLKSQTELFEDVKPADEPYHLLVDLGHPYSIRLGNLQLTAPRSARGEVHGLVRSSLSRAFDRLYTKHKASFGGLLRAAVVLLTFADIGLFQRSHRRMYEHADVVVTYVVLCCTAALEFVTACLVLGSSLPPPDDQLAQYSLVGYLARNVNHPWFCALARRPMDRLWCTAPPQPSLAITKLVYDHVAAGWKDYIYTKPTCRDAVEAYRLFNDSRGQRTLEREKYTGRGALKESLRRPFDESVLLWHLVTEFCYFDHVDTGNDAIRHSRMMSNYMAYLLFVKPEMLMPGTRRTLFAAAYGKLRKMVRPPQEDVVVVELEPTEKKAPPPRAKNELMRKVIQKVKSTIGEGSEDVVYKAWVVADELKEFAKKKHEEFVSEQTNKRTKLMVDINSAKTAADEFINIKGGMKTNETSMVDKKEDGKKEDVKAEDAKVEVELLKEEAVRKEDAKVEPPKEEAAKKQEDAKQKAEKFVGEAEKFVREAELFINEQKNKKQTKEEEKLTNLLQSAKLKAEDFIRSEKAYEEKKNEEESKKELTIDEQDLLMIQAGEYADDKMWAVIQGVWVEMLCFSAGRCRGYLHAKSLGNGGEYLSYVWLLLSYMGMETMAERIQRPELPAVGDTGALVKTDTEEDMYDEPARARTAAAAPTPLSDAPTAQAQRLVATPVPAMWCTAVVPVGENIV